MRCRACRRKEHPRPRRARVDDKHGRDLIGAATSSILVERKRSISEQCDVSHILEARCSKDGSIGAPWAGPVGSVERVNASAQALPAPGVLFSDK